MDCSPINKGFVCVKRITVYFGKNSGNQHFSVNCQQLRKSILDSQKTEFSRITHNPFLGGFSKKKSEVRSFLFLVNFTSRLVQALLCRSRGRSRRQPWRWRSQGSSIAGGMVAGMGGTKDRPGCGNIADMSGEVTVGVEGGPHGTPVKLSMTRMGTGRTLSG